MTVKVTRYTVLREDGYYPHYDTRHTGRNVIVSDLGMARYWKHRRPAEKYVGKFGGKVIEVEVTYMRVS